MKLTITKDPMNRGQVSVTVEDRPDIHVLGHLRDQAQMLYFALEGILRDLDDKETP
jgi:hypothetical protein